MQLDLTDDKSTLVQVMAWCRQATSHYLSQCWPRSMSINDNFLPDEIYIIRSTWTRPLKLRYMFRIMLAPRQNLWLFQIHNADQSMEHMVYVVLHGYYTPTVDPDKQLGWLDLKNPASVYHQDQPVYHHHLRQVQVSLPMPQIIYLLIQHIIYTIYNIYSVVPL